MNQPYCNFGIILAALTAHINLIRIVGVEIPLIRAGSCRSGCNAGCYHIITLAHYVRPNYNIILFATFSLTIFVYI